MLVFFLFVPAVALTVLGIMYITGKGLKYIVSGSQVDPQAVATYSQQRNPVNNCKFFGILMLIGAAYSVMLAIGVLTRLYLIISISTIVVAILGMGSVLYYYNAKALRAKGVKNASNKNAQN